MMIILLWQISELYKMVFLVSKTTTTLVSSQVQLYHNNNKRPQSMPFDRESLNNTGYTLEEAVGDLAVLTVLCGLP